MANADVKHEVDDGQVDLEFEGESQEVLVPDEVSEQESPSASETTPEIVAEEASEQEEYDSNVQKRINKLTKKMREAERRENEAINFAKNVQNENVQFKSRLQELDQGYVQEYGGRISAEQQTAEDELRRAVEVGDVNATVEAQKKLTKLAVAQDRYEQATAQQERVREEAMAPQAPQAPQPDYAPPQAPQPDPKAEAWAARSDNAWFGSDEAMTFATFGIHKKMVEVEGFDPQSNEYYNELDSRIRREFPHKFNNGSGNRPAQTVAGTSRSKSGRSKKVNLTPSQVAIANKLGVPLEEYAKYVK
jgi:hypothetical protein